jgi:hypothetical protein
MSVGHVGPKNTVFWDTFTAIPMMDVSGTLYHVAVVRTDISENCFLPQVNVGRHLLCEVLSKELTSITKGPNRVGVFLFSPEDGNVQFPKLWVV